MYRINFFLISLVLLSAEFSYSEIKTSVRAEALGFISSDYEATSKNFELLGLHIKSDSKATDMFKIDVTGEYALGSSLLSYINLRELYYTFDIGEQSNIYVGRRLQNWSAIDTIWNMGVMQPQFTWNRLSPQNQGLTGFFWEKGFGNFEITTFASPVYIPDQGASYEIKDGQFQSGNPFFHAPPQNVKFQGQLLPIDYDIHRPETNDVVFQSNYGLQLKYGDTSGFYIKSAALRKPSNQLALGYKGILVTTRVRVDVTPKTYYENDYSLDMGYKQDWGYLQMTALGSNPESPVFDSTYNSPKYDSSLMWGPQFLYKFEPFQFFAAYLDTSGGKVTDSGPDVSGDQTSLSERFLFKQAALARLNYSDVFLKSFRLDSSFQFMYSPKEKFREIRFKNYLNLKSPWKFWIDLILVDTDSSVKSGFESYKNYDQLWLGASYDL